VVDPAGRLSTHSQEAVMDRAPKRQIDPVRESAPDEDLQDQAATEALRRQAAAAYLRAARLTDDPAERESLRRQALAVLSPRGKAPPR
jgi:hypothetical protein